MKKTPPNRAFFGTSGFHFETFSARLLAAGFGLAFFALGSGQLHGAASAQHGEYSSPSTWVNNVVPTDGDGDSTVDIENGHVVTVTSGNVSADDRLRVGVGAGLDGTFTIQGGTFIAAGNQSGSTQVGANGNHTGNFNLTSGLGVFTSQSFIVAAEPANLGLVDVTGGTLSQDGGAFIVGESGTGIMTVSGGLVDVAQSGGSFEIGEEAGAVGTVELTGGVILTGSGSGGGGVNIGGDAGGNGGTGKLLIDGGTFVHNSDSIGLTSANESDFRVGVSNGGNGFLALVGNSLLQVARDLIVGNSQGAVGTMNSSASLETDGDILLGNGIGSHGTWNFFGGIVQTGLGNQGDNLFVGNQGTGLLNVFAGNLNINGSILVGQGNAAGDGDGAVSQTAGVVTTSRDFTDVIIGSSGKGEYTITGGRLQPRDDIFVGHRSGTNNSAGTGVLTISGAGAVVQAGDNLATNTDFFVGNSFDNDDPTDVSEGTVNLEGGLATGYNMQLATRGLGFYNQSGGTMDLLQSFIIGDSGSNTLASPTIVAGSGFANITGGVLDIDDALVLGDGNQGSTNGVDYQDSRAALGSMNVGGGIVRINSASGDFVNDDSHTEIGFNGTGFLSISGGTLLTNHPGAIGVNGLNGDGGEDGTDLRLGVTNALNNNAASIEAGTKVENTPESAPFGQVDVSAGALIVARNLNAGLGSFATGNLNVSGGTLAVDGHILLADGNDTRSFSSISGGYVETGVSNRVSGQDDGGNFHVGDGVRSSGRLDVSGGTITVAEDFIVGVNPDAVGTLNLSDGFINIGEAGTDGMGGGGGEFRLGNNATATGVLNFSGGTMAGLDFATFFIGVNGTGYANFSGGHWSNQGSINVSQNRGSFGSVNMTGGFINLADPFGVEGGGLSIDMSSQVLADDFRIPGQRVLTNFTFWAHGDEDPLTFSQAFSGNVGWAIYSDGGGRPGTLLHSGTDFGLPFFDTGMDAALDDGEGTLVSVYQIEGVIDPDGGGPEPLGITLPAGTYWLALREGPWGLNETDPTPIFWRTSVPDFTPATGNPNTGVRLSELHADPNVASPSGWSNALGVGADLSFELRNGPPAVNPFWDNGNFDTSTRDGGDHVIVGGGFDAGPNSRNVTTKAFFDMTGGTIEVDSNFNFQDGPDDTTNRQVFVGFEAGIDAYMQVGGSAFIHGFRLAVGQGSGQNNNNDGDSNNDGVNNDPRPHRAIGVLEVGGGTLVFDGAGNQNTGTGIAMMVGNEDDSSGTFIQTGGRVVLNGDIVVGRQGATELHTVIRTGTLNNLTRFATVFGAAEGFFDISGGTLDVGNNSGGGDDFIVGQRGTGRGIIHGDAYVKVDQQMVLGQESETVATNNVGGLRGTGDGQGHLTLAGNATLEVGNRLQIGAVHHDSIPDDGDDGPTRLVQTGGFLLTSELVTNHIQDSTFTATGYQFTGGVLSHPEIFSDGNDTLVISGDLVLQKEGTLKVSGGFLQTNPTSSDPFFEDFLSGPLGDPFDGIDVQVDEGFRAIDSTPAPAPSPGEGPEGVGGGERPDFSGAGKIDVTDLTLPDPNGTDVQSGALWFMSLLGPDGFSGGEDLWAFDSIALDSTEVINLIAGDAVRITEFEFENELGLGNIWDPTHQSVFALVNGDGTFDTDVPGFNSFGFDIGIRWAVAPIAGPQNLVASDSAFENRVALTWDPVAGATSYEVWRNTADNASLAMHISQGADPVSPAYDDTTAQVSIIYYYWVKAVLPTGTSAVGRVDSGFLLDPALDPLLSLGSFQFSYNATHDMEISFATSIGFNYIVQTSTDLVTWTDLTTVTGDGSTIDILHMGNMEDKARFYRVIRVIRDG